MVHSVIWMEIVFIIATSLIICPTKTSISSSTNDTTRCDDARLRCAYRTGCGMALQHYLTRCTLVLQGDINECPESCQHALIALTSTDEGKELMRCDCVREDHFCMESKERIEICRSSVIAEMNKTRLSCRIATWICNADALCSTALTYYNAYCKGMLEGKKCSRRCRNSISILRRQEKADKLNTCICDSSEDYDCRAIHRNINSLCYKRVNHDCQDEGKIGGATGNNENIDISFGLVPRPVTDKMILGLSVVLHLLTQ